MSCLSKSKIMVKTILGDNYIMVHRDKLAVFCRSYVNQTNVIQNFVNPSYEIKKHIIGPSVFPHCMVCMKKAFP